ncbi:PIR protein [Plasmodium vivax]|uniref:VIR protein n=1 Tax=Plasmodium vivax TaxID=5855 RepID=A0A565A4C0_PLAVI|nr:PIR protein [Plasmodium vivax]
MGNPCEGNTKDYLNYPCYNTLKVYFDKIDIGYYGQQYLDDTLKALEKEGIKKYPYYNLFHEIARLYGGDDAFSQKGVIPSCIYSNYWLNKYIQEKHSSLYNERTFEMLKKFDYNYSEIKYKNQRNSCSKYIKLLKPNEYQIMDILYSLYNYYDKFKLSIGNKYPQPPCTVLGIIFHNYKNILSSLEQYKDLISHLKSLKDLILTIESTHNLRCSSTMSKIVFPKEDIPNPVVHYGEQGTKRSLPDASPTDRTSVSEESADIRTITDVVTLPQPPNPERTELIGSGETVKEVTKENQHIVTPEEETHYVERTPEKGVYGETEHVKSLPAIREVPEEPVVQYTRLPEAKFTEKTDEDPDNILDVFPYRRPNQVDIDSHPERPMSPPIQSEDVGLLGKIQNTISGIVSEVEPAPILGVSGGMGALFLLFKYTPFGSFFGGRRRRMHQIPRTFGGFPPGEFPNFHEYDGGFIGYAPMNINPLAE